MPEYILTFRTLDGRTVTETVEAASGDEAVRRLRESGHSEIVLHTDDVMAHLPGGSGVNEHVSPADLMAMRQFSQFGHVLFLIGKLYRSGWQLNLAALAVLALRRGMAWPWHLVDALLIAWLSLPPLIAVGGQLFSPARKYAELTEQVAWGRWEEVLRLLPALRSKIPPQEAVLREAQALAGLGRLEEGLALFQPFSDGKKIPGWMYWGQVADIYAAARQTDAIVPANERAAELAPDNPTVLLDLALSLLCYHRDTCRARPLLEEVKKHQVSDVLAPFLEMTEGIQALEESRSHEAAERLEKALAGASRFKNASPLVGAMIDRIHTYLALAYAGARDFAAAERHFRLAEPRLRALREDDLLQRCQHALGLPQAG